MAEGKSFSLHSGFRQNSSQGRYNHRVKNQRRDLKADSSDNSKGHYGSRARSGDQFLSRRSRGRGSGGRGGFSRGRGRGRGETGGQRGHRRCSVDRMNDKRMIGLDITQLKDLQDKDSSTVVVTLGLESGIEVLLNRDVIDSKELCLILRLLAKACGCATAPANVTKLLLTAHNSKFYQHIDSKILTRMNDLPLEVDKRQLIKDLLTFMRELYVRLPHSFMDVQVLGVETLLKVTIDGLEAAPGEQNDEVRENFKELQGLKTTVLENIERKQRKTETTEDEDPPDNFRAISIFPALDDIQTEEKPFLRKNKALGGYQDLAHYLDVQFRLFREDFICPLREGIEKYLTAAIPGRKGQRQMDIRVYQDVHILRTVCTDAGLLHRLMFDVSQLGKVRWENTKRLIFGSLVCLSKDNFQTFLIATVSDRDPKWLRKGYVDVMIENVDEMDDVSFDTQFVMVETTAFFEAYRHVLRALQQIHEGGLPFERYIVACEHDVKPPEYLQKQSSLEYDLRPLVDDDIILREDSNLLLQARELSYAFSSESAPARRVHILENRDWPTSDMVHMDASQYQALKTALSKEFVIIQGPPGTGKTYVGLKIVKALLHNARCWQRMQKSPMLIVCYTNHALDQFLEGVISFFQGNIVRIGSRISNEQVKKYSLREQRHTVRKSQERHMKNLRTMRYDVRKRILELMYEIEKCGLRLEAARKAILHEDVLRPFMGKHYSIMLKTMKMRHEHHQCEMNQVIPFPKSFIVEWLWVSNSGAMADMTKADNQVDDNALEEEEEESLTEAHITAVIEANETAQIEEELRRLEDFDYFDEPINELGQMQRKIENLKQSQSLYVAFDTSIFDKQTSKEGQFEITSKARKQLKRCILGRLRSTHRMTQRQKNQIYDPWHLPMEERWKLYRCWVQDFSEKLQNDIQGYEKKYKDVIVEYKELQMIEDKHILKKATVIGMTTTAAARYQHVFTEIGPRIVVVEEAAEVLEGHIITSLSKNCEHLILIGDHKQLKPNPTVYKLAKNFNLDLSLFERMISNGVQCDTLSLQHRMRPEISSLMRHIYPELQDHPCVLNCEKVKGISHNMLFIDHKNPEEHDADMYSHSNAYEASYIVALCDYLLKQGYDRSQITVLTTYSGQLLKLKKLMPKSDFEGVHLTVVDNYQGEENDIILLSLVRSNSKGSVGFLKIENRICVALSRAKKGLFVIGNFDLLAQESLLWRDIVMDLRKNGGIRTMLSLYCQNHPRDVGISVETFEDFQNAPEGGCMKPCTFRLDCGHVCTRLCHPYDPEHKEYLCKKACLKKICNNDHSCPKPCHEECGDCTVRIEKIIPRCGHTQMVPCVQDPEEYLCEDECDHVLECGHTCGMECGLPHQCTKLVRKTFRCGHNGDVQCFRREEAECEAKCNEILKCGHQCDGNCKSCHQGRLHISCRRNCEKVLICSHKCKGQCSESLLCNKDCENHCPHVKCTDPCQVMCIPCGKECKWRCQHFSCTASCSEPCNRPPCNQPCKKMLPCGHRCIGLCGEPCPEQCRQCDKDEVCKVVFGSESKPDARFVYLEDCSHIVEVTALDNYMNSESAEIRLKECPHCQTPIRHNMRYGNSIKKTLSHIELVKACFTNSIDRIKQTKHQMETHLDHLDENDENKIKQLMLHQGFNTTMPGLTALENVFRFRDALLQILHKYDNLENEIEAYNPDEIEDLDRSYYDAQLFLNVLKKPRRALSDQEESDFQNEILRHRAIIRTMHLRYVTRKSPAATGYIAVLKDILLSGKPFTDKQQTRAERKFEILEEQIGQRKEGDGTKEKIVVLKHVAPTVGQWITCKNGHVISVLDDGCCVKCQEATDVLRARRVGKSRPYTYRRRRKPSHMNSFKRRP